MQEEEKFIGHWNTLKPLLLMKWSKLSERDLKGLNPRFNDLVAIIHAKYPDMPREAIVQDLENLRQQLL